MKLTRRALSRRPAGFTLVEAVGVLAIMAILASMLIPRVFQSINEARVEGAVLGYNTLKSATITYFSRFGRLGGNGGTNYTPGQLAAGVPQWDRNVLQPAGYLERAFETRLALDANAQLSAAPTSGTAVTPTNAAYDLDGSGSSTSDATGQVVLELILTGVFEEDARDLSSRIDGQALGSTSGADLRGRVKYAAAVSGLTDVHVYVAHK